jgi:hypothetical protein
MKMPTQSTDEVIVASIHRPPKPRRHAFTIIAQDPGVRVKQRGSKNKSILRAKVSIPAEELAPGPWGYRVQVIDYDASSNTLWKPLRYASDSASFQDPFADYTDTQLLNDPKFHQQNVYVVVMRILARFEYALGRRVSWSFGGHQLKVAPHAFADANAFYTKEDEALLFGYFIDENHLASTRAKPKPGKGIVFTCLSHDVLAHETTHALVDGLRQRYTDPSSADQGAFHEGISDVVSILSVFALKEVMVALLQQQKEYSAEALRKTALFQMAEEMGSAVSRVRGNALRNSVSLPPGTAWQEDPSYLEPHKRGEILVASMLNAMIHIWADRIEGLKKDETGKVEVNRVVEEGQRIADYLLTMSIRALDYCPPVHLEFGDYLSALVTADREIRPDDSVYSFRAALLASFQSYGIVPTAPPGKDEPGIWHSPEDETNTVFSYDRIHFEPMQRDRDEVFRFVWENRKALCLYDEAYTEVQSVRPCIRVGEDGFFLKETVAEYVQILRLMPEELEKKIKLPPPSLLPRQLEVYLFGGGTLIFDEYGHLKYHIHNRLQDKQGNITQKQIDRLFYLAEQGYFLQQQQNRASSARASRLRIFGKLHFNRALNQASQPTEGWIDGEQEESVPEHSHE